MTNFNALFVIFTLMFFIACDEEEQFVATSNQIYTYHAPHMYNRAVFVYDYTQDTLGRLTADLGSFDKSSEDISDTLNYMIRNEFEVGMIYQYELIEGDIVTTFGRLKLDSFDVKRDSFIFEGTDRISRNDVGNQILPGLYFDNFNREIVACNDFFLIRGRDTLLNEPFYGYVRQTCESLVDTDAVRGFLKTIPGIVVDTLSIEQVNYVYISY